MKKDNIREMNEYFVEMFNKVGYLLGLSASLNYVSNGQINIYFLKDRKKLLQEYQITMPYLPDETNPIVFKDDEGNTIKIMICTDGMHIYKIIGNFYYEICYEKEPSIITFSVIDPNAEYQRKNVEYSNDNLSISFGNDCRDNKKILIRCTDRLLHIEFKNDVNSLIKGLSIYSDVMSFESEDGRKYHSRTYMDIDRKQAESLINDAIGYKPINELIWNSLEEMDNAFPGTLNYLKQNTDIDQRIALNNKNLPFIEFLVNESCIRECNPKSVQVK